MKAEDQLYFFCTKGTEQYKRNTYFRMGRIRVIQNSQNVSQQVEVLSQGGLVNYYVFGPICNIAKFIFTYVSSCQKFPHVSANSPLFLYFLILSKVEKDFKQLLITCTVNSILQNRFCENPIALNEKDFSKMISTQSGFLRMFRSFT